MSETRKLAAILAADLVGFTRLTSADEDRTLARLRALRSDLIDPTIAVHNGRVFKRTGDGVLVEFRSAVDAVRCAMEVQNAMVDRNAGVLDDRRIVFRIGIHIGDVVEESDGDLMGDAVNIAARLEGIAQPGAICLSEQAYWQVKARLDIAVSDLGPTQLKNIAEPVRAFSIAVGVSPQAKSAGPGQSAGLEKPSTPLPLPDKPSIAVLAFQNMSGDPEQEYFADGMVEDIITGLSRIKWLFVIARNSSFIYKGRAVDIKQVGRDLGVRYVLEGSVRKAGGRVRITGQLVEAETGTHLWADKFDGALDDVFDLQDRITASVVGIIEPNLFQAEIERARRKRPDNLGAYDLFLRAVPHFQSVMPGDADIAIGLLEQALKLDPCYASAHALLACGMEIRVLRGGFNEADAAAGVRHARLALAHGSDDATALSFAALVILHLDHDFEAASNAIARALSLNGSCAFALYWGAHIHAFSGDPVIAEDYANRALRLSPFDPISKEAYLALGCVRLREQRYDDAAAFYAKAVQASPRFSSIYAWHAIALAVAGRIKESNLQARRLLELEPTFRVRSFVDFFTQFSRPELVDRFEEGLRRSGLPE
jgi:TolB-like protein/class 3 adenylate cyclase/tetratricopeptide (TPR) repeat protein